MLVDLPFYVNDVLYSADNPKSFHPDEFKIGRIEITTNSSKQNHAEIRAYNYSDGFYIASDASIGKDVFVNKEKAIAKIKENHEIFPHFVGEKVFYVEKNNLYESEILYIQQGRDQLEITLELLDTDDDDGYNIQVRIYLSDYQKTVFDTKEDAQKHFPKAIAAQ